MILNKQDYLNSSHGSHTKLHIKCDYCNNPFIMEVKAYNNRNNTRTGKDFCRNCLKVKNLEDFLLGINFKNTEDAVYRFKNNMSLSCVYQIKNLIENKYYIGSTKDLKRRFEIHLYDINCKSHFVNDFNGCDIKELQFEVLEWVKEQDRVEIEFKYIEEFSKSKKLYNTLLTINNGNNKINYKYKNKFSLEERLKHSKLTLDEITEIKVKLVNGIKAKYISKEYNISEARINDIKRLVSWEDVSPELNEQLLKIRKDVSGENNSCSKLKEEQVKEIKYLLSNSKMTKTDIGNKFNVSRTLIYKIEKGDLWNEVV